MIKNTREKNEKKYEKICYFRDHSYENSCDISTGFRLRMVAEDRNQLIAVFLYILIGKNVENFVENLSPGQKNRLAPYFQDF